eukprot:308156-Pleurochrysis_carterae.AAC.3
MCWLTLKEGSLLVGQAASLALGDSGAWPRARRRCTYAIGPANALSPLCACAVAALRLRCRRSAFTPQPLLHGPLARATVDDGYTIAFVWLMNRGSGLPVKSARSRRWLPQAHMSAWLVYTSARRLEQEPQARAI